MTGTDRDSAGPAAPVAFTHREILSILSGLMLGMFLAALDQTVVATAIRTIADDLNGYALQAWVTTAYLITATISTPLYGKLSDIYGRRRLYLTAISVFLAGSLLCSFATSVYMLAVFRAIQGIGAGGLMSLALAILGDILAPRERAKYQAYFLAVFGVSSVLGPVLGGFFAGTGSVLGITGWRWVFLVNIPVGALALAVVARNLRLPSQHRAIRVDWWGALALVVAVVPLLVVAEQGREWGWGSGAAVGCYVVGGIGVVAFVAVEIAMKDAALIPMRFFRNDTFALGVLISLLVGTAMFGGISLLPQYLQVVRGSSPTVAGLQMIPMVAGIMIGSVFSGQLIAHTGHYRIYPIIGSVFLTVGMFLLHTVGTDTALPVVMAYMAILGFGLGNLMQPMTLALQNALPPQDMGVSTAAATFFRQIGGTLGVAVFLSILFARVTPAIADRLAAAGDDPGFRTALAAAARGGDPVDASFARGVLDQDPGALGSVLGDSSIVQRLHPVLARPLADGFADAMDTVFLVTSLVGVVTIVLVLLWREVPLRPDSGLAAVRAGSGE
ncbi:MDR family MFS transporter [Rhodococcus phenolicus]|uniref:MDR family MFS transporter n=1 Tax=Rhodococcus phenolicus TaxID=263849 RepID=UPI0008357C51|nr:MDR family MFS transporter [Rhodococcus phenolicus]